MRHRKLLPALAALAIGLAAAGCGEAARQVADVPPPDTATPDETPIVEPVSPPANEADLPDEEVGGEGGVPEDDPVGTEDGEETGTGDETDEGAAEEDEDL